LIAEDQDQIEGVDEGSRCRCPDATFRNPDEDEAFEGQAELHGCSQTKRTVTHYSYPRACLGGRRSDRQTK
jgi:hypothetical protein